MKKEGIESYQIKVKAESLTNISGAVPDNIDVLIKKPGKDTMSLFYTIAKTQIELLCQKGDTDGAMVVWQKLRDQEFEYSCPLNGFKKDKQNGGAPYQGAHCFFGAFRDAAADFGWFYKKKGDIKPSDKHLRKYVRIMPNHIHLFRDSNLITGPDFIEGQQPVDEVRGFARYEVISHPFTMSFVMQILAHGKFKEQLSNRDMVMKVLYNSTLNGQGSRRSAGYGGWKITEAVIEDWVVMDKEVKMGTFLNAEVKEECRV